MPNSCTNCLLIKKFSCNFWQLDLVIWLYWLTFEESPHFVHHSLIHSIFVGSQKNIYITSQLASSATISPSSKGMWYYSYKDAVGPIGQDTWGIAKVAWLDQPKEETEGKHHGSLWLLHKVSKGAVAGLCSLMTVTGPKGMERNSEGSGWVSEKCSSTWWRHGTGPWGQRAQRWAARV